MNHVLKFLTVLKFLEVIVIQGFIASFCIYFIWMKMLFWNKFISILTSLSSRASQGLLSERTDVCIIKNQSSTYNTTCQQLPKHHHILLEKHHHLKETWRTEKFIQNYLYIGQVLINMPVLFLNFQNVSFFLRIYPFRP